MQELQQELLILLTERKAIASVTMWLGQAAQAGMTPAGSNLFPPILLPARGSGHVPGPLQAPRGYA